MNRISLSFFVVVLISSSYYFIVGCLLTFTNKKILDIFTIMTMQCIKIIQGSEKATQYIKNVCNTRNFKFYGVYYIVSSIVLLAIALNVL
jgi:hypothetical protein